jgi:hypothetical protein
MKRHSAQFLTLSAHVLNRCANLQVLRQVLNCSLPVEVAWQGKAEMDNATLAALQQQFGPLTGFDVTAMPYPLQMRRCVSSSKGIESSSSNSSSSACL